VAGPVTQKSSSAPMSRAIAMFGAEWLGAYLGLEMRKGHGIISEGRACETMDCGVRTTTIQVVLDKTEAMCKCTVAI